MMMMMSDKDVKCGNADEGSSISVRIRFSITVDIVGLGSAFREALYVDSHKGIQLVSAATLV